MGRDSKLGSQKFFWIVWLFFVGICKEICKMQQQEMTQQTPEICGFPKFLYFILFFSLFLLFTSIPQNRRYIYLIEPKKFVGTFYFYWCYISLVFTSHSANRLKQNSGCQRLSRFSVSETW